MSATIAAAAHRYDRRVTKEAKALVKVARSLLGGRAPRGDDKALDAELKTATTAMERSLEASDAGAIKRQLPKLDALVDRASGDRRSLSREYTESIAWAVVIALLLRAFVVEAFKIPSASMIPTMQIGDFIFVNKLVYGVRVPFTRKKLFDVRGPRRGEVVVFMNPCTPEKDFIKRAVAVAGDTVEVRCSVLFVNGKAVPSTYIDEPCRYWDFDEGDEQTPSRWIRNTDKGELCSAYREQHGGYGYTTYHEADRPDGAPHPDPSGHDFPDVLEGDLGRLRARESQFHCSPSPDRRGAEERARAQGRFEPTADPAPGLAISPECGLSRHYVVPAGHFFAMGDNRSNSNDSRSWGPVPYENLKGKAMFIWLSRGPDATWMPPFRLRWDRMGNFVHQ